MAENQLHYFTFAFQGEGAQRGVQSTASVYMGFPDKNISMPRIQFAKRGAGMRDDCVLIGLSYLGFMTPHEMANGQTGE